MLGIGVFLASVYSVCSFRAMRVLCVKTNEAYWDKVKQKDIGEKALLQQVPGYCDLLRRQSSLNSLVALAAGDSIGLYLDLPAREARLMIKGLGVRSIPLQSAEESPFFTRIDPEVLYDFLSRPMNITRSEATIPREPLQVVQAPKDSTDILPSVVPDTTQAEPVYFVLDTDRNIRFFFYQTEGGWKDHYTAFFFDLRQRWCEVRNTVGAMGKLELPPYTPTIRIGLRKADAKVLYRALPSRGQIVLTF